MTPDKDPSVSGWEWSLATFPCLVVSLLPWVSQMGAPAWLGKLASGYNGAVSFLLVLLGWKCVHWARRPGPQASMDLLERAIARFLPTHLMVMGVSILAALAFRSLGMSVFGDTPATQWLSVVANLFLVHGWFPAGLFLFFWNPHLWIAGAGLFLVQLAVPLIRGLARGLQGSRQPLWWIATWLWVGSYALVALLQEHVPTEILDVSGRMWLFGMFPGFRVWEFALGAIGCLAFETPHRKGGVRELLLKSSGARLGLLAASLAWNLSVAWLGLDVLGGDRGWLVSQSYLTAPAWLGVLIALRSGAPIVRQILSNSRIREIAGTAWIAMLLAPWSFWACVWMNGHGLRLWLPGFLMGWMAFTAYLIQRFWASPMERLLTRFMDRWKRRRAIR